MNLELKEKLKADLKIIPYEGENPIWYECRLIYSAFSEWMRYIIFDEVTDSRDKKSKKYILSRGCEILSAFIQASEDIRRWFLNENKKVHNIEIIVKEMRNKMILSGEYLELLPGYNLTLPDVNDIPINRYYDRIVGLSFDDMKKATRHVGITKIKESENEPVKYLEYEIEEFMDWICKQGKWCEIGDIDSFEFFDPYSKQAPYKSWVDFPVKKLDLHLGRLSLYNNVHEYYLFRRNIHGEWETLKIKETMSNAKEERRIITGLRHLCKNNIYAKYIKHNHLVELRLFCRLPIREEIFIETYCWPMRCCSDKLNYIVPIELWNEIKEMLGKKMGIRVEEQ